MSSESTSARNEFFRELKPRCVAINNLAIRSTDKKASARELISVTEDLSNLLDRQVANDGSVLDEKLADYVFFPLSNILRGQQEFPMRLTEVTLRCLRTLIQHGWRSKIPPDLAQQLLVLLTFIIGGVPGQKGRTPPPEETKLEAFRTLAALIIAVGSSPVGAKSLVETKSLPALGHTITTILDGITDRETAGLQLEALLALESAFIGIKDHAALATFLPGIVSALTKLLAPPESMKTPKRVLIKGISVLKIVLIGVLGDIQTMGIQKRQTEASSSASDAGKVLTGSWLRATADQVKLALTNVLKLRKHRSDDVRSAMERLCITLLDECHRSLANCTSILVESAMILAPETERPSLLHLQLNTSLTDLATVYPELTDTIKQTAYNWATSLPRLMQSSDQDIRQQAVQNLQKAQRLVSALRVDSETLNMSLAVSLRDSVTTLIEASKQRPLAEVSSDQIELSTKDMAMSEAARNFQPLLMNDVTQVSTRVALMTLFSQNGSLLQQAKLATDMLEYVQESTGSSQVASYWMAFELVKSDLAQNSDLDELLDLTSVSEPGVGSEHLLQELYAFSVSILDSGDGAVELDWRMPALALEVTTYTVSRMGVDFRPELIDVLYPIATFLGSEIHQLRQHAIVSLNSIAYACGYLSVADLIIDNVDYMVNSVSLRLNSFEISPASTQVLKMMVKLTGPKLVPYLDDVVASIFAALDNYHGYSSLVENLFSVLAEIVNQGTKSNALLLEDRTSLQGNNRRHPLPMATLQDISELLHRRRQVRRRKRTEEDEAEYIKGHPAEPWKERKAENPEDDDEDVDESMQNIEKKPPATPTYTLLSRITNLTQHYLTSPTPTLRKSLLDLLTIVCPALSPDEESFLPLVNSIWPVLLARLFDPEPFVVISACRSLSALCASAGDFLNTRLKTEWWETLGKWCAKAKSSAKKHVRPSRNQHLTANDDHGQTSNVIIPIRSANGLQMKESPYQLDLSSESDLGEFTQVVRVWDAVQELLVAIVSYVGIEDDIFEEILELLADRIASKPEIRTALEAVNADAVWLAMHEQGRESCPPPPKAGGRDFIKI